jgi:lysophospholipase L1-like esterase
MLKLTPGKSSMKIFNLLLLFSLISCSTTSPNHSEPQKIALPMHISGRVQLDNTTDVSQYRYSWPGVYFEAEFNGPALDVKLDDSENILNLIIDDKPAITLIKPGKITYSFHDLGAGNHRVRLEKLTETQSSIGKFSGFFIPDNQQSIEIAAPDRRIEFIGDSYTVGYGNISPSRECTTEEVFKTTNTQLAFGPLVAKHFNADYQINASSGFGIVRNYNGTSPDKSLIKLYPHTLNDSGEIYSENWSPQVIVIGLGTNDFSTALNPHEKWKTREELQKDYVNNYVDFVTGLNQKNPRAHFVLMASDGMNGELAQQLERVVTKLKTKGNIKLDHIIFKGLEYGGCHWHPSVKDDQTLAKLLIDFIESKPIWK